MKGVFVKMISKFICLLIIFLLVSSNSVAQDKTVNRHNYIKGLKDSADNDNYVYLYYTNAGQKQKIVHCIPYKNQQLISIDFSDSLFIQAIIKKPQIFMYLNAHEKYLKAARRDRSKEKNIKSFRKDFTDSTVTVMQLGVKIKGLHYNHFQKTAPGYIAGLKNKKKIKGYMAINHIIDIMESSAAQSLAEKN